MRVVVDTNVIISALLFDGLPEKLLLSCLVGSGQLVLSPYIIAETKRILESKFSLQPENLELLQQLLAEGEVVYFEPFLKIISDEPDNRIIETAVQGRAEYIVTGDKLLLELSSYKEIHIVTIKELIDLIGN